MVAAESCLDEKQTSKLGLRTDSNTDIVPHPLGLDVS